MVTRVPIFGSGSAAASARPVPTSVSDRVVAMMTRFMTCASLFRLLVRVPYAQPCRAPVSHCTGARHWIAHSLCMKFINMFLVGYFVLIVGLALALWQTGVLGRVAPIWIGIGAIVATG